MLKRVLLTALVWALAEAAWGWAKVLTIHNEHFAKEGREVRNFVIDNLRIAPDGSAIVRGWVTFYKPYESDVSCDWVARVDQEGEILWHDCFTIIEDGDFYAAWPTRDQGTLLVGQFAGGSVFEGVRIAKLDARGAFQWHRIYVPLPSDLVVRGRSVYFVDVLETGEGYLGVGNIVDRDRKDTKTWIVALDLEGNLLWQKTLTGFLANRASPTQDGGLVVGGVTGVTGQAAAWVLRLDSEGRVLWQKSYSGEDFPQGSPDSFAVAAIGEAVSGDLFIAGVTMDDANPDRKEKEDDEQDFRHRIWVARLDAQGRIKWRKLYGKMFSSSFPYLLGAPELVQISPTADGLYVLAESVSTDWWLAKLDGEGAIAWQKKLYEDYYPNMAPWPDGRLLLAGVLPSAEDSGNWLLALEPDGSLAGCGLELEPEHVSVRPAPFSETGLNLTEELPPKVVQVVEDAFFVNR